MIEKIIDKKTSQLLEELKADFQIDFEEKNINYCEMFQINGTAKIYFNPAIIDTETITHELLHIWLNKYNYRIGNYIYMVCSENKKLGKIFTKFLCDYIENCFDHNKMYPKYLEMGYSPEKFIVNGLGEKCHIKDIKSINLKFLGTYNSNSINRYIGNLISIYADHVDNDYTEHLKLLREKDDSLFSIITDFWNSWINFDITNIDPIFNSDIELSENFITAMEFWIKDKRVN